MLLFVDIISGDEMFTDANKYKVVHEVFYEIECKFKIFGPDNVVLEGANASAEGGDEDTPISSESTSGIDVVKSNRLAATGFNKKSYMVHIKDYLKAVATKLEAEGKVDVTEWKKKASTALKEVILPKINDWQFYNGESENPEGMVALLDYRGDNEPYMLVWKDALEQQKL